MQDYPRNYFLHASRRTESRYGFSLLREEYRDLCMKIAFAPLSKDAECALLWTANHDENRQIWAIWHKSEWMPVVFDSDLGLIVTFLPKKHLRGHSDKLPW